MKTKIVVIILAIALLAVGLTACNKNKTADEEYSNVSRSVSALYTGESETYSVTVERGMRENDFIADGTATDVRDFAEITVTPLKVHDYTSIGFSLANGATSLSGTVTSDDFGEFKVSLSELDFQPLSVTLSVGEAVETVDLQNVLENKLTSSDVINIAKTEFADRIAAESQGGALSREIYVKLITGDRENYYYYVSFIGEGVDFWALLINPETGAVISRK